MNAKGTRIAALLILQILGAQTCYGEAAANPALDEEASKQSRIYQSRGDQVPEGYVIDRSLLSYSLTLSADFHRSLAKLGRQDRWLDIGAGEGRAILDYCTSKYDAMHAQERRGEKAQAVAISIEDRRTHQWHRTSARLEAEQIQYLYGRRLRDYSRDELGQFQIITDVMGGFSYTRQLSVFMEKALTLLDVNGSFYTVLQDVHAENGIDRPFYPGARFLTEIANGDGAEVRVCSWLKAITCVEVACDTKAETTPPIEVYRIRKVCNSVKVPSLVSTHFEAGTPPERGFRLTHPLPAPPGSEQPPALDQGTRKGSPTAAQ